MDAGIGVNKDAFGSETLGSVVGDGIAKVEAAVLSGVEIDLAIVLQAGGEAAPSPQSR